MSTPTSPTTPPAQQRERERIVIARTTWNTDADPAQVPALLRLLFGTQP